MTKTRTALVAEFIPESPLVKHLGIRVVQLGADRAELLLPFARELATMGDVVHGGAIASLIDTAGMAAAWANEDVPERLAGSTVSLTVDYVAPARGVDLLATAEVVRRGRMLCFVEVTVREADGGVVAKGLMTHRYG